MIITYDFIFLLFSSGLLFKICKARHKTCNSPTVSSQQYPPFLINNDLEKKEKKLNLKKIIHGSNTFLLPASDINELNIIKLKIYCINKEKQY